MSRWRRKYRPNQCPNCTNFRPARDEQDPRLKDIASWTKNRCVARWKYWWEFDQERELVGSTDNKCQEMEGK